MNSSSGSLRSLVLQRDIPRALAVKALRGVWPGVIWSPFSPVRLADLGTPPLPGPEWIRVRNRQCGVCATDLSLLLVKADPGVSPAALTARTRYYLGHEVVSDVVETGPEVRGLEVGDRVVMGTRFFGPDCFVLGIRPPCRPCAEGKTVFCENAGQGGDPGVGGGWGNGYTAHQTQVFRVPQALSDDQASLVEPMAIALHAVLRRPPAPGERVLVLGSGIIGLLVIQALRIVEPSARVIALARHPQQAEAARRLGAQHVIRSGDHYEEIARLTGGRLHRAPLNRGTILGGLDVVYDCVGKGSTLTDALRWTRAHGAVVLVGIELSFLKVDLSPVWHQEVDVVGASGYIVESWRGRRVHTFELVMEMLQEGTLSTEGLITHRFPFSANRKAIATALDKRTGSIKVMFDYRDGTP
jgi:threonine dehydrogenase-like Zn-dependent dehydrogenase